MRLRPPCWSSMYTHPDAGFRENVGKSIRDKSSLHDQSQMGLPPITVHRRREQIYGERSCKFLLPTIVTPGRRQPDVDYRSAASREHFLTLRVARRWR